MRPSFTLTIAVGIALACAATAEARERPGFARNATNLAQDGPSLSATVSQSGVANTAGIQQVGRNNTGVITQTGENNTACLIQIGHNLSGEITQTGGQSTGLLQSRRGDRSIPVELCTAGLSPRNVLHGFGEDDEVRPDRHGRRARWESERSLGSEP